MVTEPPNRATRSQLHGFAVLAAACLLPWATDYSYLVKCMGTLVLGGLLGFVYVAAYQNSSLFRKTTRRLKQIKPTDTQRHPHSKTGRERQAPR